MKRINYNSAYFILFSFSLNLKNISYFYPSFSLISLIIIVGPFFTSPSYRQSNKLSTFASLNHSKKLKLLFNITFVYNKFIFPNRKNFCYCFFIEILSLQSRPVERNFQTSRKLALTTKLFQVKIMFFTRS